MRALLSVADRTGVADLARELLALGVDVVATDGTREALAADGIAVRAISELTHAAPLIGGQVKTFHPEIYAGILARRDMPAELESLLAHGIGLIDLVVVNVRPLGIGTVGGSLAIDEAAARIDVGGLALLSAAGRSFAGVAVASDPAHYPVVLDELRRLGAVTPETRLRLAAEAFAAVAAHDAEVAAYLGHLAGVRFPERLTVVLRKRRDLPYGENPHQEAAFYRETTHRSATFADAIVRQGPEPTFNDLMDLDAAYRAVSDFGGPASAIVKQLTPVGLAANETLLVAYRRALEGDPGAAHGAVVACNRTVDAATAAELALAGYEAIVAPGYSVDALTALGSRPSLTLLEVPSGVPDRLADHGIADLDFRRIEGGLLVETRDRGDVDRSELRVVTKRRPSLEELTDLLFAWRAVRHVRSNAVVLARHAALVGVGAGQPSRMTSVEVALHRAAERSHGAVLASDAYFPFADAIALAGERGVSAIIQPGGSVRDEAAVEVADRHHMAMVFTGRRHFRR